MYEAHGIVAVSSEYDETDIPLSFAIALANCLCKISDEGVTVVMTQGCHGFRFKVRLAPDWHNPTMDLRIFHWLWNGGSTFWFRSRLVLRSAESTTVSKSFGIFIFPSCSLLYRPSQDKVVMVYDISRLSHIALLCLVIEARTGQNQDGLWPIANSNIYRPHVLWSTDRSRTKPGLYIGLSKPWHIALLFSAL